MTRFKDKVALVTGGRSGIGKAIATRLEQEGARVFTAQRQPDPRFEGIVADLSQPESAQRVVDTLIDRTGRLDVLVNNAGVMHQSGVEDTSLDSWQHTLMVNLTAPFLLIKSALPHLSKHKGSIVNIGSIEGLGANPKHASYCASKAGLHGLTRAVAIDHGQDGIRCNTVAPGWIDTDLNLEFIASTSDPETFQEGINGIHPVNRTGTPEDVAALVAFLAAEESGFVTGQTYIVDGGRMAKLSLP